MGVKVKGGQQGVGTSSSPLVNSLLLRDSKRRGSKVKGEGGEGSKDIMHQALHLFILFCGGTRTQRPRARNRLDRCQQKETIANITDDV